MRPPLPLLLVLFAMMRAPVCAANKMSRVESIRTFTRRSIAIVGPKAAVISSF
jgi:hypothetical protein